MEWEDYCNKCGRCCGDCKYLTEDNLCSIYYKEKPDHCFSIKEYELLGLLNRFFEVHFYCGYKRYYRR